MTQETLTVLRTTPTPHGAPRYATKRWVWNLTLQEWQRIAYDAGATFTAEERPVSCLADVAAVLEEIRHDPTAFVVRGELLPEARAALAANPRHRFRRAKKASKAGKAPTLAEVGRHWLMIDVDGYPLPDHADLADDPEAAIEAAVHDLLPPCFHDVECFWQLSASAGFKPGVLKVHLFFWLAEPISNEDLKLYLHVHAPAVDRAPYNAAQPHYIADPIIESGHDPLPRRTGWLKGSDDVVTLPALDLAELRAAIRQKRERAATGAGLDASAARTMAGALALLGDDEGHEGWHAPLRRATLLYARQTSQKNRDDEAVKAACRDAIDVANEREAGRHAAADIARFCSDAYLDALLDGAFVWVETSRDDAPAGTAPAHEAPQLEVRAARDAIRTQMGQVLQDAAAFHAAPEDQRGEPRHVAMASDVGTGKSRTGREMQAEASAQQKRASAPHRLNFFTPTIKLGAQAEIHFADMLGMNVAIHRGREQPDPFSPGNRMCLDVEAVKLATAAGENVDAVVCGVGKKSLRRCPHADVCGYQNRQRKAVAEADAVVAAHEAAWHLPQGVRKGIFLTTFDEGWWQTGLQIGRGVLVDGLADSILAFPPLRRIPGGGQIDDLDGADDLHALRSRLERALKAAPEGYLRRETLVTAGLTVADCARARNLEWNRKREGLMWPGMSRKDRAAAAERAGVNASLPKFAAMWGVLADLLASGREATGRAELMWRPDKDEVPRWTLSLNTIRELADPVTKAPVLLLDATLPVDLVRPYLPRIEAAAPVRVKTPHMRVRQVRGGWGKTTLLPGHLKIALDANGEPKALDKNGQPTNPLPPTLASLRDYVAGVSRGLPGWQGGAGTLVITYQDAEAAFAGLPNVATAHFNDIAGRDEWRDVRFLFVIGRPRPRSDQVRLMAAALTGEPVEVAESQRETRGVLMADGTGGTIEVRAYANPAAEAVSVAITDAEIIQAVGRCRGVNRTAADPVQVWLMADVATPLVVDELLDWRNMAPSAVERMACRGIVLTSATDAAKVYPDILGTAKAASHAFEREGLRPDFFPNPLRIYFSYGDGEEIPLRFTYRPPGRGQQIRVGYARSGMDPEEIWRTLEDHLGELATFTPDEPRPQPEPSPDPSSPGPSPAPAEPPGFWEAELHEPAHSSEREMAMESAGPMVFRPPDADSNPPLSREPKPPPPPRGAQP
ncbi:hypothetical protein JMJ56_29380 [Belnapia sp. T18]|uniref:Uncharacterized protein n=1 Tax=Belnapia arida TaxID=2804533 RepID=A0ABS1UBN1_9PROT|nr:hypothetical protein [Belnapia arida]MBL6082093.1 hypothetical protein [Belnapia arida]